MGFGRLGMKGAVWSCRYRGVLFSANRITAIWNGSLSLCICVHVLSIYLSVGLCIYPHIQIYMHTYIHTYIQAHARVCVRTDFNTITTYI